MSQAPTIPPAVPEKKKLGCWFYGCLTLLIVALLGGLGIFLAARYGLKKLQAMVNEYTETSPLNLPEVTLPKEQQDALDKKIQAFKDALDGKAPAVPLVLSGDEINALVARNEELKGRVHAVIDGDQLKGSVSIPMEHIPLIGSKGRYLNGSGTFQAGLTNGVLWVTLQTLEVKGKPLPEEFMKGLRGQNLAKDAADDPRNREIISKLDGLELRNGLVTIRPKAPTNAPAPAAAEPAP